MLVGQPSGASTQFHYLREHNLKPTLLTHSFYDGVFFVHTSFKSLAGTTVSSTFFALFRAKNLLNQKRHLNYVQKLT